MDVTVRSTCSAQKEMQAMVSRASSIISMKYDKDRILTELEGYKQRFQGKTLLHYALEAGDDHAFLWIVQNSLLDSLNIVSDDGTTPLSIALDRRRLLLSRRPSLIHVLLELLDNQVEASDLPLVLDTTTGKTVFHEICCRGRTAILKDLVASAPQEMRKRLLEQATSSLIDASGQTPILAAAKQGRLGIVYEVLDWCKGIEDDDYPSLLRSIFNSTNNKGENLLHLACWHGPLLAHMDSYILRHVHLLGLNLLYHPATCNGWTPLHYACCSGKTGFVRHLIENGACGLGCNERKQLAGILTQNNQPRSDKMVSCADAPFLLAAERNNVDIIRVFLTVAAAHCDATNFLSFVVDVNSSTSGTSSVLGEGATILHFACMSNRLDTVTLVVEGLLPCSDHKDSERRVPKSRYMTTARLDVVESKRGQTPVLLAAEEASECIVLYLISRGARLCFADKSGRNLLHFACSRGWMAVVQKIAKMLNESDLLHLFSMIDDTGQTPLLAACINNHYNIVRFLLSENFPLPTSLKHAHAIEL